MLEEPQQPCWRSVYFATNQEWFDVQHRDVDFAAEQKTAASCAVPTLVCSCTATIEVAASGSRQHRTQMAR